MKKPRYSFPVPVKAGPRKSCERIPGYCGRDIFIINASPVGFKWIVESINSRIALEEKLKTAIASCDMGAKETADDRSPLNRAMIECHKKAYEEVLGWLVGEERKEPQ